jgi:MotA/TolQ/ExbB proton channel family protein
MAIPVVASEMGHASHGPAVTRAGSGAEAEADSNDSQRLAWLANKSAEQNAAPYHYVLVMRFALINIFGFALLGAAYTQGLVELVVVSDQTYLSVVIALIFFSGLGICGVKVWSTSRELNQIKSFDPLRPSKASAYLAQIRGHDGNSRGIIAAALRLKLSHRISVVRQIAASLVLLGLIGTVVGFIIALSGVKPDQAADVKAISPMVSTLIAGMSTALYTTLVGSVFNVWLMANYHLLAGGTVKLISGLLEFGEENAPA